MEVRVQVGRLLAAKGTLRRGELALYAQVLAVSPRTLRKWRDQAEDCPVMGRPRHAERLWRAALLPVARAWKSQGRSSGLPRVSAVLKEAGTVVPVTIARELLRLLKARWRRVQAERRTRERVHLEVLARDVLWSEDATHLGRDALGKVEALAVKDVATTRAIAQSVGGAARGQDVRALLGRARRERGTLPLVLAMDNGPANRNALVLGWLARERVIVLWSLPHTPQHNAWAESFHGELKLELRALGELAARDAGPSDVAGSPTRKRRGSSVSRVARLFNARRVRPSRGGLTAAQLDRILPPAEDLVRRARFYDAARAAIEKAAQGIDGARARRRAEREAVLCTLEQFGLVTRTRGRRPAPASKAARLS
ncbi:MAG: hypothetical protein L0Y64_03320 [Myxococcaceae bacterium]|nr:hypothetical protein [Myxococcaceae bacterium]